MVSWNPGDQGGQMPYETCGHLDADSVKMFSAPPRPASDIGQKGSGTAALEATEGGDRYAPGVAD